MFNFYEGIVGARAVSDRGFISPISPTAFLYYRYRLEGTTVENNQLINKIEVIPKRKFDPVFAGYIYIAENLWRIQSVDLFLTKNAGIEFIDTLHIKQVHLPVDDKSDIWMPVNSRFDFRFGFLGFEGGGTYVSVQSDYVINPVTEKKFFSGEILKIKEDANKKDSAYWQQVRPIPLTQEEVKDYVHKDSIAIVRDSKSFKDSVDRITNKFSPVSFVLTGYDYRNRYHKINLHFSSVLQSLQYNTIEGVNLNFETEFVKEYEKKKKFFVSPNFRYGFSNRHFNSNIGIGYLYNHIKKSEIKIAGGSDVAQFNGDKPVSSFINTFYSLFEEKNYLKIFEKHFALLEYKTELVNGINLKLNSEYAQRFPLQNTSAVKWKNFSDREFTTNLPATIENPFVTFTKNNSFVSFAEIKIHIKQKYISRPETKYILESKFPVLILQYKKGIKKLVQSNVDFDECTLGLEHEIAFGMLGHLNYSGYYHQFINSKKVFISDYRQFMGNQTIFSGFTLNSFNMLDYYAYSTTQPSFEIHGEYHFNGLLFNKIPLLRSLHFDEIVSAHFLHVKGLPKYLELSAGVEKLGFLRFDVVTSFTADKKTATALRVGIIIVSVLFF
jgi:hypothetical protein